MSDLISRSELLKYMENTELSQYIDEINNGNDNYNSTPLYDYVKEMPTAYSVENVVEELEIERKTANNTYNSFNMDVDLGRVFGLEKAIEIVKQGVVSDDVCKWEYNDTEYCLESSCNHLHIFMDDCQKQNEYSFCPYCGKKIKVVE